MSDDTNASRAHQALSDAFKSYLERPISGLLPLLNVVENIVKTGVLDVDTLEREQAALRDECDQLRTERNDAFNRWQQAEADRAATRAALQRLVSQIDPYRATRGSFCVCCDEHDEFSHRSYCAYAAAEALLASPEPPSLRETPKEPR